MTDDDTAAGVYRRAHALHYDDKNLDEAEALYAAVLERFPDSPEAGYAKTQLANIEKARNPPIHVPKTLEQMLADRFRCALCRCTTCVVKQLPLGGAGVYRDAQRDIYLVVTCRQCSRTDFYDMEILESQRYFVNR